MDSCECSPEELLGRPLNDVETKFAPKILYTAGDRSILQRGAFVSIVGSRKASQGGLQRAAKLVRILAQRHVVVISGLAEGIDTTAHKTAMESGGRTIAVLGTPLDQYYPKHNKDLQLSIIREHLAVSQFRSGVPIRPANFPQRNRTMALLSDATVIIEASDTSGSLSQGWEALRLGRGLFIARAIVRDKSLSWPKKMLDYGAQVLSDDTLPEFFELIPNPAAADSGHELPF
jgi:DNA processing protein